MQTNQEGLKWNGIYQLLVCAFDVNFMNKDIHSAKKGELKEDGLEINTVKTKYLFTSHKQNAGQNYRNWEVSGSLKCGYLKNLEKT